VERFELVLDAPAVDAIALGHQLEGSLPVGVRVVAIRAIGRSVEKTRDRG
jgi:hypothetical protein